MARKSSRATRKHTDAALDAYDKAGSARRILHRVDDDANRAIALSAVLSRVNDSPALRKVFDQTIEAHGLNVVTTALRVELILALNRMHDRRRDNRASLPHLFHLLEDKGVRACFIEDAHNWLPGMGEDRAKRNACVAARRLGRAKVRWMRLNRDPGDRWIKTLQDFRHEHLAHALFDMPAAEKAKYGYIGDLLDSTLPIVQDLRLAIDGHNADFPQMRRSWVNYADVFLEDG